MIEGGWLRFREDGFDGLASIKQILWSRAEKLFQRYILKYMWFCVKPDDVLALCCMAINNLTGFIFV